LDAHPNRDERGCRGERKKSAIVEKDNQERGERGGCTIQLGVMKRRGGW